MFCCSGLTFPLSSVSLFRCALCCTSETSDCTPKRPILNVLAKSGFKIRRTFSSPCTLHYFFGKNFDSESCVLIFIFLPLHYFFLQNKIWVTLSHFQLSFVTRFHANGFKWNIAKDFMMRQNWYCVSFEGFVFRINDDRIIYFYWCNLKYFKIEN